MLTDFYVVKSIMLGGRIIMKIMEVIPSFEPLGGAENFVFNLSLSLNRHAEVFVVSLYDRENSYIDAELKKNGISIIYLNKKEGLDFRCSRQFDKLIASIKPDIVHLHINSYLTSLPAMIAKKSNFIYTFHTMISRDTYGGKNNPRNVLLRFLIKNRLMFPVTISDTIDQPFKSFFGEHDSQIIYNGIDIQRYSYKKQDNKKYSFISVGSFNDIKNNLFMIKCVERLINDGFDTNYIVLGEGKNFEKCKEYCLEHNLTEKIKLLGAVNNVEEYLSESSCLLLASHWEGNPLVINEAISSGVWVVANGVGGVKDLIDDTNGYLVTPENEDDFVDKMKSFLTNEKTIKYSIIPENIEKNRRKVDLNKTCFEYLDLMRKVSKRG